jgi:predicted dehydrogenase
MSEVPIRVAIAGAGTIANMTHIEGWRDAGAEVIAVADTSPGRAQRFAAKWKVPSAFESVEAMLTAVPEIDVVSVCVPPFAHRDVAIACLEAGKHIYLEKPSAANEAEMVEINDTAHRVGKLIMTGSHSVYSPNLQAVKRYIEAGNLGEIYFAKSVSNRRRGTARGWFRQSQYGVGGVGMDTGSHSVDRMLFLLGSPKPVSVTARTYIKFGSYIPDRSYKAADIAEGIAADVPEADVEDMLVAFVQFENGITAIFENTWAVNIEGVNGTWIYGTKAGLSLGDGMVYSETPDRVLTDTKLSFPSGWGKHTDAFVSFIDCIRENKETQSPGERGIIAMRILDAIYASAAQGGKQICFD